jgi:hypothetical protein
MAVLHLGMMEVLVLAALLFFGLLVAAAVILAIVLSRKANKDRSSGS